MDEGVEEAEEGGVTAGGEFNAEPNGHGHHTVVDHVEGRDMVVLFPQDEKDLIWNRNVLKSVVVSIIYTGVIRYIEQKIWA